MKLKTGSPPSLFINKVLQKRCQCQAVVSVTSVTYLIYECSKEKIWTQVFACRKRIGIISLCRFSNSLLKFRHARQIGTCQAK